MALVCAISGEVPQEPVVSPKSGAIFERRLIEKYLAENGKDPVNEEPLAPEELIALQVPKTVKPRPPSATSIPVLLKMLQDEWDATMLQTFEMSKHVQEVRQEMTHAMYQHDAACRVIARLTNERNQARQALALLKPGSEQLASAPASNQQDTAMEGVEEASPLPDDVVATIDATQKKLSEGRKKRAKPDGLPKADDFSSFKESAHYKGFHSSRSHIAAISSHPTSDNLLLTCASDKHAIVFDTNTESVVSKFTKHSKKVHDAVFVPSGDLAVSGSADTTVRVWNTSDGSEQAVIKAHNSAVVSVDVHPSGDYVLSTDSSNTWAFSSLSSGETYLVQTSDSKNSANVGRWHPDGLLFGVGCGDNTVKIWDIKTRDNLTNFEGHTGAVTDICFSENGYYLASAAKDSTVKIWDLRKLKNIATIDLSADASKVCFDNSGSFLAIAGAELSVYTAKQPKCLLSVPQESIAVSWNHNSTQIRGVGRDDVVRVYKSA